LKDKPEAIKIELLMSRALSWFDAGFICSTCGHKGFPCPCVATCEQCGMIYREEKGKCGNRVHQFDKEVGNAFANGYWRIDPASGRLYKTRSSSIQHIYQELDKGNVFFSRKEFNQLAAQSTTAWRSAGGPESARHR
jgi:hypothetical protein